MTRVAATVVMAFVVALVACDEDPARLVKIVERPPATGGALAAAAASVTPPRTAEWRPAACPPPPEGAPGPSTLNVTGPCAFEHRGVVSCESRGDDFIVAMSRKAADGATLMIYINVEHYHGPDSYDDAQMFLSVQHKTFIYRWSSDTVPITVSSGEASAVLSTTRLDAEPLLVDCSGPMTNYNCSGRGASAIEGTTEVVSGTLQCATREAEK